MAVSIRIDSDSFRIDNNVVRVDEMPRPATRIDSSTVRTDSSFARIDAAAMPDVCLATDGYGIGATKDSIVLAGYDTGAVTFNPAWARFSNILIGGSIR